MTQEINLTQGKVALVEDRDYCYLMTWAWTANNIGNTWYAIRSEGRGDCRAVVLMHRVILQARRGQDVDHVNHNGLDNRRENVRVCTRSQNNQNQTRRSGGTSRFKGVWLRSGSRQNPWRAEIKADGKRHYLGKFATEEAAALAYNEAAEELFGEFAFPNVLETDS